MSPDTLSSLFPDRPIRPLPKRKIREKLSPEVADSIKYPLLTAHTTPLFIYPPYTLKEEERHGLVSHEHERNGIQATTNQTPKGDDAAACQNDQSTKAEAGPVAQNIQSPTVNKAAASDQRPFASGASLADGDELLENASNKKKRKIPSAGDTSLPSDHVAGGEIGETQHLTALAHGPSDANSERNYPAQSDYTSSVAHTSSVPGMSGPGRGRLGRSSNGRSPLRPLPDGNNSWLGRSKNSSHQPTKVDYAATGIITSAIASAEKSAAPGQENAISLLQQHSSPTKSTPTTSQFTFTCGSQVPGTMHWPGLSPNSRSAAPRMATALGDNGAVSDGAASQRPPAAGATQSSQRRDRRKVERELIMAAHHRRQIAAENYYHSPPKPEEIWICEFCEYERIFGRPPRALIRNYEVKDRQQRQEEVDRKRLLEKAKAKSRKAKKAAKNVKGAQLAGAVSEQTAAESRLDESPEPEQCHSTQSEYEYEDEFENGNSGIDPAQGWDYGERAAELKLPMSLK